VSENKIKVLYISGFGRSGTTILDNLLGQIEGFFSVGEICHIWDRSLAENRLCGCGVPFRECQLWNSIFGEAFGGIDNLNLSELINQFYNNVRTRHIPWLLVPKLRQRRNAIMKEYLELLERLYRGIQKQTHCKVIVDSSKKPAYGYILSMSPLVDLYVIHMVRDSRAVAYSWQRRKALPDAPQIGYMEQYTPLRSAVMWSVWNRSTELFWKRHPRKYILLRYEDFVADPQSTVRHILSTAGEADCTLPFISGREVQIMPNHTTTGNPIRLNVGKVELRLDREWEIKMKLSNNALVTILTWPLLIQYGYLAKNKG
jgi:hypothetical protein